MNSVKAEQKEPMKDWFLWKLWVGTLTSFKFYFIVRVAKNEG
jgi:hypothetical protein